VKHEKLVSKKCGDDYWAADKARAKTAELQQKKVRTLLPVLAVLV
jgi:hypothetical protein